ncbi:unnamed protein product [Lactuca saligna]|uniref:Uncharacterized protein n=1 Tax=Lactuca saligna TaxID=75948 RepID=A0AA35YVR4_LACSI|nr:unnamed protein product [Lactuca saligna]
MTQSSILNHKTNQNMILDLDPAKYDVFLQPIVECLRKTQYTKSRFCNLLRLSQGRDLIDPEIISNSEILEMFYQTGYKETLIAISKFKKPKLSPMCNGLFTLLFRSFSERVTNSDCARKFFMTLMYNIYSEINLDYGSVIWAQMVQSTLSTT